MPAAVSVIAAGILMTLLYQKPRLAVRAVAVKMMTIGMKISMMMKTPRMIMIKRMLNRFWKWYNHKHDYFRVITIRRIGTHKGVPVYEVIRKCQCEKYKKIITNDLSQHVIE